jgi:AAA15 family ATPase/GTPase
MLCQFSFWNYKSYRDEVTLDFTPANINDHPEHLITCPETGEKFLPLAVIYGPNAGGKSNVIEAFWYFREIILRPITAAGTLNQIAEKTRGSVRVLGKSFDTNNRWFRFDQRCAQKPTGWTISFSTEGFEYKYTLAIIANQIQEETLYSKDLATDTLAMLFERNQEGITLGESLRDIPYSKVDAALPLLSYLAITSDIEPITNIIVFFMTANTLDYGQGDRERMLHVPSDEKWPKHFYELLHKMDIPIDNLAIQKDDDGSVAGIFSVYIFNGEEYNLELSSESSGTKKIFTLITDITHSLEQGRPLFIDELDAKLHPKLLEFIISLYTNPETNKNGAQLVFTSHDLYTMDKKFLRRDEIWFAVRREDHSSHLYSLSDFKKEKGKPPRNDESYAKQYVAGRYGADPYFQRMENWGRKE